MPRGPKGDKRPAGTIGNSIMIAPISPGKIEDALPKSDKAPNAAEGQRKIEIPLPSDQDVDRVMSFLERAWRRLIDMASRVQKDASGKL